MKKQISLVMASLFLGCLISFSSFGQASPLEECGWSATGVGATAPTDPDPANPPDAAEVCSDGSNLADVAGTAGTIPGGNGQDYDFVIVDMQNLDNNVPPRPFILEVTTDGVPTVDLSTYTAGDELCVLGFNYDLVNLNAVLAALCDPASCSQIQGIAGLPDGTICDDAAGSPPGDPAVQGLCEIVNGTTIPVTDLGSLVGVAQILTGGSVTVETVDSLVETLNPLVGLLGIPEICGAAEGTGAGYYDYCLTIVDCATACPDIVDGSLTVQDATGNPVTDICDGETVTVCVEADVTADPTADIEFSNDGGASWSPSSMSTPAPPVAVHNVTVNSPATPYNVTPGPYYVGDMVNYEGNGTHPITITDPGAGAVVSGGTVNGSFTATMPGVYNFQCDIHTPMTLDIDFLPRPAAVYCFDFTENNATCDAVTVDYMAQFDVTSLADNTCDLDTQPAAGGAPVSVDVYPDVATVANAVVADDGACGPALTQDCPAFVVTNDYDANGANPDFTAETGSGNVTFTITNSAAPTNCQTATEAATFDCVVAPADPPYISEIHYDNSGADANECIEVAVPNTFAGNLIDCTVTLYNGSTGAMYDSETLNNFTVGNNDGTNTYYVWCPASIQNGGPDGLSLDCVGPGVIEFWSYEGTFAATDGPANGMNSTDMGVSEDGTGGPDESLENIGGVWQAPACNSMGDTNVGSPLPCNPVCDIVTVVSNIVCDDGGTPNDPADDTFTFDVTVTNNDPSFTNFSDDQGNTGVAYGSVLSYGPFAADGTTTTITYTDDTDSTCTATADGVSPSCSTPVGCDADTGTWCPPGGP